MTSLNNSLNKRFNAGQEIAGIAGSRVPPITTTTLRLDLITLSTCGRDVDTGKLGADDGRAGSVLRGRVAVVPVDRANEHGSPGPVSLERLLERGAGFRESWRVRVIVECAQIS